MRMHAPVHVPSQRSVGALYWVIETVFFKESRPDLESIMSGPIVGADLGRHHRLATSAAQIDYVAAANSWPSDVGEGTLRWMGRQKVKACTFGPRVPLNKLCFGCDETRKQAAASG